jgi:hypothetical protein
VRRVRKILLGLLITALTVTALEISTRAYVSVRRRNFEAWRFGFSFWDSVRLGAVAAAEREAATRISDQSGLDEMFAARDRFPIAERSAPQMIRVMGFDVRLNSLGLRGEEPQTSLSGKAHRLLILGGSFVFGWGVPDDAAWVARLAERLRIEEPPTAVVNGGRNGGTINWALTLLLRLNHQLPFDEVLLISTYNNRTLVNIEGRPTWASRAEYYLYNSSLFYVMLEEKIGLLQQQSLDYEHRRAAVRVSARALNDWQSLYRHRLAQIAELCREHHRTLWVGAEPQRFFDAALDALTPGDPSETAILLARVAEGGTLAQSELNWLLQSIQIGELHALAATGGAVFLDATNALTPDKRPWMLDEIHLNRSGSERFATFVATALSHRN